MEQQPDWDWRYKLSSGHSWFLQQNVQLSSKTVPGFLIAPQLEPTAGIWICYDHLCGRSGTNKGPYSTIECISETSPCSSKCWNCSWHSEKFTKYLSTSMPANHPNHSNTTLDCFGFDSIMLWAACLTSAVLGTKLLVKLRTFNVSNADPRMKLWNQEHEDGTIVVSLQLLPLLACFLFCNWSVIPEYRVRYFQNTFWCPSTQCTPFRNCELMFRPSTRT